MLSEAKHLAASRDRPFASLRVTWCDGSHGQGLFFTLEPCLSNTVKQVFTGGRHETGNFFR